MRPTSPYSKEKIVQRRHRDFKFKLEIFEPYLALKSVSWMLWTDLELVWCGSVRAGTNAFHFKSFIRTWHLKVSKFRTFLQYFSVISHPCWFDCLHLTGIMLTFFGASPQGLTKSLLWLMILWRHLSIRLVLRRDEVFKPLQWLELPGCDLLSKLCCAGFKHYLCIFSCSSSFSLRLCRSLSLTLSVWMILYALLKPVWGR